MVTHLLLGIIAALSFSIAAGSASFASTPMNPRKCTSPESRQFDFWVGEWNVTDRLTGQHAGESRVERLYGGCVLRENWSSDGFSGGSLNSWWTGDRKWHQTWMDQAGAFRHFIGGLVGKQMILTADQPDPSDPAKPILVRLTFTPHADGTVRQYSDVSRDGGKTWRFRYDYLYRRMD